jgi:hypothetical protein
VTVLDDSLMALPSPEELKNKILVKCHKPVGAGFSKVSLGRY